MNSLLFANRVYLPAFLLIRSSILIFLSVSPTQYCKSQQLIFRETFNTSRGILYTNVPGNIGTDTSWQLNRSGNDWGACINAGRLELTNDASNQSNNSGWAFAYIDNTNLPSWPSSLVQNTGVVSWTFNMRQPRNDPSGFTLNNYGLAFILAGSHHAPFDSGYGYAVVIGQPGTIDPVRLIRYNNGLSGLVTDIIISNTSGLSDLGNEYLSIEVRYMPSSNRWELLLRNDGASTFQDPAAGTLISQGTAIDHTYTHFMNLQYMGAYWCGNTAVLQNALFDHIQLSTGCANTQLYYRTIKNGKWQDPEIWEMCTEPDNSCRIACYYPTVSNSVKVEISEGDTVIIDSDPPITIGWIMIQKNSALILNNNAIIHIGNGNLNGADLENNGCLIDNANSGYGINFLPNTGAAWSMSPNAILIRSNGSNAIPYRDNYQNGMMHIPASAKWIVRYTGNHVPMTATGTGACPCDGSFPSATYYPNLIIESNAGVWNSASSIGARFTGKQDYATVKGDLMIGGNGSGNVLIYNENTNPAPMLILGNLMIKSGSMFSNYNPLNPSQIGTGFEVKGHVHVDGMLKINGAGNSGRLVLSGPSQQIISGGGNIDLQDVTIQNTSETGTGDVILNRPLAVHGELRLNQGIVHTTSNNILVLTDSATCPTAGKTNAFINGPVQKKGNSNFIFPVGKPAQSLQPSINPGTLIRVGGYRPIGISNLSGNETFIGEYQLRDPYLEGRISNSASATGLQSISRCEYWDLKRTGNENAEVIISWSTHPNGQSDCNKGVMNMDTNLVQVVPYYNGQWGDQHAAYFGKTKILWNNLPDSLKYISWNGASGMIDSYQKFVIGTTSLQSAPLNFQKIDFNVRSKGPTTEIFFRISGEKNINHIDIERSPDGIHFKTIKTFASVFTEKEYFQKHTDTNLVNGWNYYRLRIKDESGQSVFSQIESAWIYDHTKRIRCFPNPVKNELSVEIAHPEKINYIQIINQLGQVIFHLKQPIAFNKIPLKTIHPGMYYLQIISSEYIYNERFIKE